MDHRVLNILKWDGSNPPLRNILEKHIYDDMKGRYEMPVRNTK